MILVNTSIWIDHLRSGNPTLTRLLDNSAVVAHPWVTGELALGNLNRRDEVIGLLHGLPQATVATSDEILSLIEQESVVRRGHRLRRCSASRRGQAHPRHHVMDQGQASVGSHNTTWTGFAPTPR